ncbi:hypothetical protein KEM09_01125 [Carboxylicivirga mesophila]|uniref:Secretion system C-terminal sorting domain-containing protein n=1 Tax=Carboxylicivirga mesophila TaxID=1166478 RepID=A0ABS5K646_9BACT|nr:T9SS type A sorting domain-containing protein [Carboxylicivirga mesophila]MBS2209986.1 hypothetical protein [Carboxylicivirga mesophila]
MKKVNVLRRILPIAVLALLSTGAFGKGKIFISSYLKTDYAVITARFDVADNYRVKIFNKSGEELYASSRISGAESFQKLFDLKSLADGEYTIELTSKKEKSSEKFTIENHSLVKVNGASDDSEMLKAFFRVANDKLYVSHMNFNEEALSITIGDRFGTEIYNSNLPTESTYSGMFDLTNLPSGAYMVSLTSGNKEYSYEFNK